MAVRNRAGEGTDEEEKKAVSGDLFSGKSGDSVLFQVFQFRNRIDKCSVAYTDADIRHCASGRNFVLYLSGTWLYGGCVSRRYQDRAEFYPLCPVCVLFPAVGGRPY